MAQKTPEASNKCPEKTSAEAERHLASLSSPAKEAGQALRSVQQFEDLTI
jgi:hypothetical protein